MSRRTRDAVDAAAAAASDAARTLQARQQEKQAAPEPKVEAEPAQPKVKEVPRKEIVRGNTDRERVMEELRASRGEKEPEAPAKPKAEAKDEPTPEPKAE